MRKYLVTFYERRNDEKIDFSFTTDAADGFSAIDNIKNGKGDGQLQSPSRLSRKFIAKEIRNQSESIVSI